MLMWFSSLVRFYCAGHGSCTARLSSSNYHNHIHTYSLHIYIYLTKLVTIWKTHCRSNQFSHIGCNKLSRKRTFCSFNVMYVFLCKKRKERRRERERGGVRENETRATNASCDFSFFLSFFQLFCIIYRVFIQLHIRDKKNH